MTMNIEGEIPLTVQFKLNDLKLAHPALQPIIELHSPGRWIDCHGCEEGPDYSGEWPCRTIELILEGINK